MLRVIYISTVGPAFQRNQSKHDTVLKLFYKDLPLLAILSNGSVNF